MRFSRVPWPHRRNGLTLASMLIALLPVANAGAALSDAQVKQLNAALNDLRQAKTNYDLAAKSVAGSRAPSKAKVKLAVIRLDSAEKSTQAAAQKLEPLPPDDAKVIEAVKAHASVTQAIASLRKQLSQGTTTTPPPNKPSKPGEPAPPTKPTKPAPPLPASQRGALSQVDLILRTADVALDNLEPMVERILADPASPGSAVQSAGNQIMQTNAKLKQAQGVLQKLPKDHPKVASMIAAWQKEIGRTQTLAKKLLPRWQALQQTGQSVAKTYAKDMALLKDLQSTYRDHAAMLASPKDLAETLGNDKLVLDELKRISEAYKAIVAQQTNEGNAMASQFRNAVGKRKTFIDAAKAYHPTLLKRIASELEDVRKLRTEAVEKKKPLYLTGGVEQQLGEATDWIAVLNAYAPQLAAPFLKQLTEEREAVKQARITLKETIIQANPLPPDRYKGDDREQMIKLAIETWKKEQPDAEVLTARIPSEAWTRQTKWTGKTRGPVTTQGSDLKVRVDLTKTDSSRIQVQLIVADKDNPKLAIRRPVNLWKNHLAGDTVKAYNFYTLKDELQPNAYLLRARVK